ncbi:UDP-N-acetylmuramoyl-L-alanyl-D-glutamate--2,6-diaminopimelate ligase [Allofranklinella schreckenbergeri]|uniref:UDP-N-acetylmuramoyl-L-alanyl-D-glutamate--2,6-diaminopimelate ligase n=1 Tax=Allofranklinella schreckenbergeri TaxID=1076744 RepID=A0A3M6R4E4_9BURK|nr:UDP-N-acetylmuramoyl-L-alanyl-D-glutamate--2,6-diaminopimelate ligase [Allofranklinella schreckenbergeri]RMX10007.1 UDP-N-acetylmuramoyl-L-alanyl-D-glutamate--2,6-diaminopimelate ligase [Allofranklinella schreckenbergeri]
MSVLQRLDTPEQAVAWLRQRVPAGACLHSDSRLLQSGDVFLAWPGFAQDGRKHVVAALRSGASAVLAEARDADSAAWLHETKAKHNLALCEGLQRMAGEIAALWWGQPSAQMDVLAVTGTNGKTTLAWWLAHACGSADAPCGYVGTLGVGIPPMLAETGMTSPDALRLQWELSCLREQGATACALEASSIGLEQGRLNGTRIPVAVFTNLTQDHLDYHGTMQAYGRAKQRLFEWPDLQVAVVNAQDAYGVKLRALASVRNGLDVWDYAVAAESLPVARARLMAVDVQFSDGCATFEVQEYSHSTPDEQACPVQSLRMQAGVTGLYNVQNVLALLCVLRARGMALVQAAAWCVHLPAVPGRMQIVPAQPTQPLVVVDYAHTPDALRAALQALRPVAQQRGGQLNVVFGCGGDRDPGKRPLMAMAAAQGADALWITSDNPRRERPAVIIAQVVTGLTLAQRQAAHILEDRRQAIAQAVTQANACDVVLIAGKGHEDYQEVKGVKHPFSDMQEAQQALRLRSAAQKVRGA